MSDVLRETAQAEVNRALDAVVHWATVVCESGENSNPKLSLLSSVDALRAALASAGTEPELCPGSGTEQTGALGGTSLGYLTHDFCPTCEETVEVDDGLLVDHPVRPVADTTQTLWEGPVEDLDDAREVDRLVNDGATVRVVLVDASQRRVRVVTTGGSS